MNYYSARYAKKIDCWVIAYNGKFLKTHPYGYKTRMACEEAIRKEFPGSVVMRKTIAM